MGEMVVARLEKVDTVLLSFPGGLAGALAGNG